MPSGLRHFNQPYESLENAIVPSGLLQQFNQSYGSLEKNASLLSGLQQQLKNQKNASPPSGLQQVNQPWPYQSLENVGLRRLLRRALSTPSGRARTLKGVVANGKLHCCPLVSRSRRWIC